MIDKDSTEAKIRFYDVIVLGGGASGMVAAIFAKRSGKKVLLIEKNKELGRKILTTGNGRCNISNENVVDDYRTGEHYNGENPKFVISALNQFGLADTKEFFQDLGVEFVEEDEGRLFPASNQAQSVLDVLSYELEQLKVKVITENTVKTLFYQGKEDKKERFSLEITDGRKFSCKNLSLAVGGKTYPNFGSTGDGYDYAKELRHSIIEPFPVYTGLEVDSQLYHWLQGTKLEVGIEAFSKGESIGSNVGTIMFSHYGLSAPVVLELSRKISYLMNIEKTQVELEINFLPGIPKEDLEEFLIKRWARFPQKSLARSFDGLLPKKIFPMIMRVEGIDKEITCSEVTVDLRKEIVKLLSEYRVKVTGVRGFEEAHFTGGGVDTKEINPKTLESKITPGLYFCGEILDIDGECGGYNLQWAWTSGAVVGRSVK
jgi:hypothetical protein